ncbi:MAG: restriction endonuclease subunit S [Candidatus Omnitrophota bacterium]
MKKKISEIAEIKSGYLFKKGITPDREGTVRVVQLKDVSEQGVLNLKELQLISLDNIDAENFLSVGDVLLKAKTNHPISTAIKEKMSNTIATAHYFIISVKQSEILPGYLAWYLNQRPAQIYFNRNAGGTRIQVINKKLLEDLEVVIPVLETQTRIEKIYELHLKEQELADRLKEKKRTLVEAQLLEAIKK